MRIGSASVRKQSGSSSPEGDGRSALGVIVLVSLAVRLFLWSHYVAADPMRGADSDAKEYQRNAIALVETGRFAVSPMHPDVPETLRTPGYPLFLAAFYRTVGVRPSAAVLGQIVLSLGTVALTFRSARRLWNTRVGAAAALLLAIDPLSTAFCELLLSETLFAFAVALLAAIGIELAESPTPRRWAFATGITIGMAAMIRPIAYYLVLPVGLGVTIVMWSTGRSARDRVIVPLLVVLPFTAIVGSWQWRNDVVAGSPEFSRVIGAEILHLGPAAIEAEGRSVGPPKPTTSYGAGSTLPTPRPPRRTARRIGDDSAWRRSPRTRFSSCEPRFPERSRRCSVRESIACCGSSAIPPTTALGST